MSLPVQPMTGQLHEAAGNGQLGCCLDWSAAGGEGPWQYLKSAEQPSQLGVDGELSSAAPVVLCGQLHMKLSHTQISHL